MRIVIASHNQFGYHIDAFNYAKTLSHGNTIVFICFDSNLDRIVVPNIQVIYLPLKTNFFLSRFGLMKAVISEAKKGGVLFIQYFFLCSILCFFINKQRANVDFRSSVISQYSMVRFILNCLMRIEAACFTHISAISEGLVSKLKLPKNRTHIIPLGASKTINIEGKNWSELNLLYVGTFNNRHIERTIQGVELFYEKYHLEFKYIIIGNGLKRYKNKVINAISKSKTKDMIFYLGPKYHEDLLPFLTDCNIGVSYVPITDYFDVQPPTKTFEYVMSGMYCLATSTQSHKEIISNVNGALTDGTIDDFAEKLNLIHQKRHEMNSVTISKSLDNYSWELIIKRNLLPYLNEICNS